MDEDVHDAFGYDSPPRSPEHQFAVCPDQHQPSGFSTPPEATSPADAEGTPKVPLVPFAGRPDKACPPAPKKGKAPSTFYDHVSGEAPVRRLSFGGSACASPEPSGAIDSMDEDDQPDTRAQQHPSQQQDWAGWGQQPHNQQQQQQHHGTPQQQPNSTPSAAAAAHPADLHIPSQQQQQQQQAMMMAAGQHQDHLLLSPSPPPVQQLFSQQQQHPVSQQQQQQVRPQSVQQQLFMPASAPSSSWQLRPQQLWPCQQQQQQPAQPQQQQQQQPPQSMWGNPLSPTGAPRPSIQQGSTTPARLFR